MMFQTLWLTLFCYLIGSIPFALIAGKLWKGVDIRDLGSGNAGATNALRVLGFFPGILVLILDYLKGFLPLIFFPLWLQTGDVPLPEWIPLLFLTSVVLGHVFPVWAGFRGGKAVACGAGGVTVLFPPGAAICLLGFLILLILTRKASLGSLTAAWLLPVSYFLMKDLPFVAYSKIQWIYFLLLALTITYLHRKNLSRLIKGKEENIYNSGKN